MRQVTEYYSRRVTDGASKAAEDVPSNSWRCVFLSDGLRICRMADGSRRTYAKVEPEAATAELARLRGLVITKDPEAVDAWLVEQAAAKAAKEKEGAPKDDPNDDRPLWQKRLDEEAARDGRYNGAKGLPPVVGGGGGPTTR